jgi:hypothetical protein
MEIFSTFLDGVIHSSSNMWFGLLLILISMLPPAFNTLSTIIGFKGDRKRGIAMLWQATKFGNLNGAFAGLALLGFYNGFTSFCDILPKAGSQAFPEKRCKELLETYRRRYPQVCLSKEWIAILNFAELPLDPGRISDDIYQQRPGRLSQIAPEHAQERPCAGHSPPMLPN